MNKLKETKMKNAFKLLFTASLITTLAMISACEDNDPAKPTVYEQEDQMARPAINTVFVSSGEKNTFNTTPPSQQGAAFATKFNNKLLALNPGYTTNVLGLNSTDFTGVLATDVLTVSLTGTTTFFDGTNVLTGRTLADDVITVELILLFGGSDINNLQNPGLIDDHVDANDKDFSNTFPYLASPF